MIKESVKDKIIGTWKLISWTFKDVDGQEGDFFGPNPVGMLIYDTFGYMNAQLMRSTGRGVFNSRTLTSGTPEEIEDAYKSYAAYFGRYEERSPGELTHIVEGSLQPNWVGEEELRFATVEGDCLILSAPPVSIDGKEVLFNVCWQRIK